MVTGWGSALLRSPHAHIPIWFCLPEPPLLLFLLFLTASPLPFPSVSIIYFQVMAQALPPARKALFIYSQIAEEEGQRLTVASNTNNGIHVSLEISQQL